jgi:hypothetical protein
VHRMRGLFFSGFSFGSIIELNEIFKKSGELKDPANVFERHPEGNARRVSLFPEASQSSNEKKPFIRLAYRFTDCHWAVSGEDRVRLRVFSGSEQFLY